MAQATCFEVVLGRLTGQATGHQVWDAGSTTPYTAMPRDSDRLILNALSPLKHDLDAVLTRGDHDSALRMAYTTLSELCIDLAACSGESRNKEQVLVHALLIELQSLPDESRFDGTLDEGLTAVRLKYRNWTVERNQAAIMAEALVQRCPGYWPNVANLL